MYHFFFPLQKKGLLWWAKTAAKAQKTTANGPFGPLRWVLLRRFHPPALHCHNSYIVVVTKSAAINTPFSGTFGFFAVGRKSPIYAIRIDVYRLLVVGYVHRYCGNL